jgi:polynucleotide 5'-kinase involved in rRNA processing
MLHISCTAQTMGSLYTVQGRGWSRIDEKHGLGPTNVAWFLHRKEDEKAERRKQSREYRAPSRAENREERAERKNQRSETIYQRAQNRVHSRFVE